jgi:hypothetical protein
MPFLVMETTDEPIDCVNRWQEWYRKHRIIADVSSSLVSSTSNEGNNSLTDYCKTMSFQKAKEYFSDTIAEFANELSGKELYKAFYAAAVDNMDCVEKEYNKAKQLVDMLRHNNVAS